MTAKIHWHLGYSRKMACGMLAYPTDISDEYDTVYDGRAEATTVERKVTCKRCRKALYLDKARKL